MRARGGPGFAGPPLPGESEPHIPLRGNRGRGRGRGGPDEESFRGRGRGGPPGEDFRGRGRGGALNDEDREPAKIVKRTRGGPQKVYNE